MMVTLPVSGPDVLDQRDIETLRFIDSRKSIEGPHLDSIPKLIFYRYVWRVASDWAGHTTFVLSEKGKTAIRPLK